MNAADVGCQMLVANVFGIEGPASSKYPRIKDSYIRYLVWLWPLHLDSS